MKHYLIGYYEDKKQAWPIVGVDDLTETVIAWSRSLDEAMDLVHRLNSLPSDIV